MLIIVESPHKAKTIKGYLGKDFEVLSSVGHIRELPSKDGSVDTKNNFAMDYQIKPKSVPVIKKIIDKIKEMKNKVVYLATDPDREGEGIAFHLFEVIKSKKIKDVKISRITFNEITKKAVLEALKNPRDIDYNLVHAQESRLALDYLVGFGISPILWRKLPSSKSAGRVQSVALRMIAERENEIVAFKPKEYWTGSIELKKDKSSFFSDIISFEGNKFSNKFPSSEKAIDEIFSYAKNSEKMIVSEIGKKKINNNPYPPFSTSTLQQEAYRHLGMSSKITMGTAQKLYEGIKIHNSTTGLITYMRTDAVSISDAAIFSIRDYISKAFGSKYLPEKPIFYKTKVKNAQEAHEAIRPVDISITPDSIKEYLDDFQYRLYNLIWKRTVASQMTKNEKENHFVIFFDKDKKLESNLSYTYEVFDGYRKLYSSFDDEESKAISGIIGDLKVGDSFEILSLDKKQHFTNPPARFNEASLIKELESMGIGRPSTYASIISIIQERGYVLKNDKKSFTIEPKGMIVSYFLIHYFSKYVQYEFTANLEDRLDSVSNGNLDRIDFLNDFWKDFEKNLSEASLLKPHDVIMTINKDVKEYVKFLLPNEHKDGKCKKCSNGEIDINIGKFGVYFFCSNYPACDFRFGANGYVASENTENSSEQNYFKLEDGTVGIIKAGPYGSYIEVKESAEDDKKIRNVSIPKDFDTKNEEALKKLASLPITLGKHSETKDEISVNIGRFGPYIKYKSSFISVKKDIFTLTLSEAEEFIAENLKKKKIFKDLKNKEIIISKSRFGITAKYNSKYYAIKSVKTVEEVDEDLVESALKIQLKRQ